MNGINDNTDLDIRDISMQINEYKMNIIQTLEEDNKEAEIPHYNQVVQMFNHFAQLCEHVIDKADD